MKFAAIAAAVVSVAASAMAVSPVALTHGEHDFAMGQFSSTVLDAAGAIALGRQTTVLMASDAAPAAFSAVAVAGKTIYAGGGADTAIYRIEDGKAAKFAQPPGVVLNCLLCSGKHLLAGTGGQDGGVYRINADGKVEKVWSDKKAQHVWALVQVGPTLYAATGSEAAVWAIAADGKAEVVYSAPQGVDNIQCLSAGNDGKLYAGTDSLGLVILIDPAARTGRAILDADEDEISAIVPDGAGGVYAATSDPNKAHEAAGGGRSDDGGLHDEGPLNLDKPLDESAAGDGAPEGAAARTGGESAAPGALYGGAGRGATTLPAASTTRKSTGRGTAASPFSRGGFGFGGSLSSAGHEGNAVYHIAADGLVRDVFRKPVVIHGMIMVGRELVLATGNDGAVYAVDPAGAADQSAQLVNTEARQATALAAADDGRIIFVTANKGSVVAIEAAGAGEGTFTSEAIDASQIARWGTIQVAAAGVPAGAKVAVATRTGNVAEPDDKTWAPWSEPKPITEGFMPMASPAGRFMQYRLTLTAAKDARPTVRQVEVVHQVGNLAPVIAKVQVQTAGGQGGGGGSFFDGPSLSSSREPSRSSSSRSPSKASPARRSSGSGMLRGSGSSSTGEGLSSRSITIDATDANNDELTYKLYFREVGSANWIKMADKLTDGDYTWDTRTVGDGKYEIKAVVSDSPSNPASSALEASKVSQIVVIDNTPPAVRDLAAKAGKDSLQVSGLVVDATSRIASIHYSIDSAEEWLAALPADGICDSQSEKLALEIKGLKPGTHRIAVRATDAFGNTGYGTIEVTVEGK